jgi:hypothetical protein
MSDTDTETQRMSTDEIALVREIVWWRRNHGIDFVRRINPYGAPYWKDYRTGREVWYQAREQNPVSVVADRDAWPVVIHEGSVAQTVDVLVAYGYLPARFSSAYRAGWHAAQVWEQHPATARRGWEDEFKRLFHDPLNVSFPTGGDA